MRIKIKAKEPFTAMLADTEDGRKYERPLIVPEDEHPADYFHPDVTQAMAEVLKDNNIQLNPIVPPRTQVLPMASMKDCLSVYQVHDTHHNTDLGALVVATKIIPAQQAPEGMSRGYIGWQEFAFIGPELESLAIAFYKKCNNRKALETTMEDKLS